MSRLSIGYIVAAVLTTSACGVIPVTPDKAPVPKDGELALPGDYKNWPKFLHGVQRPDAKQVRDIYVNPKGHATGKGLTFPHGTVFVMENYKARTNPDNTLLTGPDGKLAKGELAAIFVMGKGPGWGKGVAENLATGEWVFAAYKPDGGKSDADLNACRACHVPLKDKDFVARVDEYFQTRGR